MKSRVSFRCAVVLILCASTQFACDSSGNRQIIPKPGPNRFKVKFETTKGDFVVSVRREWSPYGADRFCELVNSGFYDDCAFFRVLKSGRIAQFGISGDPAVSKKWHDRTLPDDLVRESNGRGYLSFAKIGAHSRTTQIFINFGDNSDLDDQGFSPFGRLTEGIEVVDSIYSGYREEPNQLRIEKEGNAYLHRAFPKLDYIKKVTIVEE